ncbi:hypothetical protein [Luxibacter massiliensis]|uniref:hypothetical protein n=1 Tax=Luxibacter massiliensis TaxID=2219695 RepID=UPI000F049216|nr:hypothetical protein [Luxibacter massiliensis]
MNPKLPYYMAYPMPLAYDDEKVERMDFEYMKSLYPSAAKKVLPYVEDECDRLEYQCSMMYDEYPDKLQLRMMSGRIYDNVMKHEKMFYESGYEDVAEQLQMEKQQAPRPGRGEPAQNRPPQGTGRPNWLRDLIEVMLYQELYKRRCDNRRCRRRFY